MASKNLQVGKLKRYAWFFLLALLLLPNLAMAQLRVGVMTMQPGEIFWERFGHNSIVIDDNGQMLSYNFGFFNPSEAGFIGNFIKNRMNYIMAELPLEQDLSYYRDAGRGVSIQWLNLTPSQALQIQARLKFLAKPENAHYRYEYYTNNCATKVRDVIDNALGGVLYKQMTASSLGNTYRSESVRLAWPAKWMAMGFDLALSSHADKPMNRWQDAFIPMLLQQSLGEIKLSNGQALVASTQHLLPHKLRQPPSEMPQWSLAAMAIGLALAGIVYWASSRPKLFSAILLSFWFVAGLFGAILLGVWIGTEHYFVQANENILLLSPLAWLAFAMHLFRQRGPHWRKAYLLVVKALGLMAVALVLLKFMPFSTQKNINWILLLLPLHWIITRQVLKAESAK